MVILDSVKWTKLDSGAWKKGFHHASFSGAQSDLPRPSSDLDGLISDFSRKGFTASEIVALSGAHSIGQARCLLFRNRIYNVANTINSTFATSLQANCPLTGGDNNLAPLDAVTPNVFHNNYYRNLQEQRALLHLDQALVSRADTATQVDGYATSSATFFNDFADTMVRMSNLDPLTGTQGEIRANCWMIN